MKVDGGAAWSLPWAAGADQLMKHAWLIIICGLLVVAGAMWFGGRLLTGRHTVGRYHYPLPSRPSAPIDGKVIWDGIQHALATCGMQSDRWAVSPISEFQLTNTLPRTGAQESVLIILTNQESGAELYVRVESKAGSSALDYHLYRPK